MDTFHSHCKDGTDGSRDFRAVSGLPMLVLLAVTSLQIFWSTSLDSLPAIPLVCFAASFFIASSRPYKKTTINVVVSFMFGLTALYLTVISHTFTEHKHVKALIFLLLICILVPHLVLISYISYKFFSRSNNCVCHLFEVICSKTLARFFNDKSSERNHYDSEREDSSLLT